MNVFTENNIRFRLNSDGTASVELYIPPYSSSVVIPEKVQGYPVTQIEALAFRGCHKVHRIRIPASVTCIESDAFKDCGRTETFDNDLARAYTATSRRDLEYMFGYGAESYESRLRSEESPVKATNDFTAIVIRGSYAEIYCEKHNISYIAE